ncbi:glutathione peroxidase [Granulibacter bethesdensis]|uniref:glutathione peroxidase n=1 Tax=Granulibacter bethesdensis TaxID=364410 RepID=UPI0009352B32|nr:glutathione peroxidase [Granulibacter bethesdensis]
MTSLYDFQATMLDGQVVPLSRWRGQVALVVNTASRCGFTPQYQGLEALYQRFVVSGFVVLGFPCNQFGAQEPGSSEEIRTFCDTRYGVSFPMFARVEVNGTNTHPLFDYLTRQRRGLLGTRRIKWNFTKFLIGRDGVPVARYAPSCKPEKLEKAVSRLL